MEHYPTGVKSVIPGFELRVVLGDLVRVGLGRPLLPGLLQLGLEAFDLGGRLLDLELAD